MRKFLIAPLFLISFITSTEASTYYVTKTGSDGNSCAQAQNPSTSRLTINGGLSCVSTVSGGGAGHVVEVAAGTYAERLASPLPTGTSWSAPFTLKAKAGDVVTIRPSSIVADTATINLNQGSYYIIQGFVLDGTNSDQSQINLFGGSYIRFQDLEIINTRRNVGIFSGTAAHHIEIVGGSIHDGTFTGTTWKAYGIYIAGNNNLVDGVELL